MKSSTISWFAGATMATAVSGICQDRFGSLDGYIAHLRAPGEWVQVPIGVWLVVIVLAVGAHIAAGALEHK